MSSTNIESNYGLNAINLEQDFVGRLLQQNELTKFALTSHEMTAIDDSSFRSTSSIRPAPICRQFWKAGNYDHRLGLKPTSQNGTGYLRIHPKFLHSNATSHKWVFGAVAELLDNSVDEVQNGATFVVVDKTSNPRDEAPALLILDDGGGMDPEAMRCCLSFGFSDKKSQNAIGKYGNGFKTSSMRLGADVVVFSRCRRNRILTQSVGLLSYTFLMQTGQDRIVVPMVDYQLDTNSGTWKALHNEQHLKNNLSILLQWSPFSTEAELLKQFDEIGPHGTKIIIYNLWHNDEGKMELDFESDPEDICLRKSEDNDMEIVTSRMEVNEQHLANRLYKSLRAYLSILYLEAPVNFNILLRGRAVEYRKIANDLKYPEFIIYRPHNVDVELLTTIGFLKEAPAVNIHGFNVYHKNRLILPFWHDVTYAKSRGRGVVGVLEANFVEPTHNKQDFEKTPVFQKLETRLKDMTQEYCMRLLLKFGRDYHCGLIGYNQHKKASPRPNVTSSAVSISGQGHCTYQPVLLGKDSRAARYEVNALSNHMEARFRSSAPPIYQNPLGMKSKFVDGLGIVKVSGLKRKGNDQVVELERVKRTGVIGSRNSNDVYSGTVQISRLREEVRQAHREHDRLLLESKIMERVKMEILQIRAV
ncbi:Protein MICRORCHIDIA 6 [Castilleja foliolosa]|uniref:Protein MICRORCHIDIA 6 n=1 Tax=Castilleja foliolosa TaxID=1961234 RepID=A0ABD3CEC6_9LAMI